VIPNNLLKACREGDSSLQDINKSTRRILNQERKFNLERELEVPSSNRNLSVERTNLIQCHDFKINSTNNQLIKEKKVKQENYRRFLEKQIQEKEERKRQKKEAVSVDNSIIGLNVKNKGHFNRYRKRGIDADEERIIKQRQIMKNELVKQIEEHNERKREEKLKKKQEDEKEEERIRKEQEELARKMESEEQQLKNKMAKYRAMPLNKPSSRNNKLSELEPAISKSSLKLVGTAIIKASVRAPVNVSIDKESSARPSSITNLSSTRSRIDLKKILIKPTHNEYEDYSRSINSLKCKRDRKELISEYERQIEILKNQNQIVKEEVLLYKEQLLRELELKTQANSSSIVGEKKYESKLIFEESLCSSTKQVPGIDLDSISGIKEMEQSLCSETKLVAISKATDGELYRTWRSNEIKVSLEYDEYANKKNVKKPSSMLKKNHPVAFKL